MTKRELIDRKALIDNGLSKGFCEWYDEIKQAEVITEQEIVKPYLEKLRADIEAAYDELDGYDPDSLGTFASRIDDLIDNLLSESEGKK